MVLKTLLSRSQQSVSKNLCMKVDLQYTPLRYDLTKLSGCNWLQVLNLWTLQWTKQNKVQHKHDEKPCSQGHNKNRKQHITTKIDTFLLQYQSHRNSKEILSSTEKAEECNIRASGGAKYLKKIPTQVETSVGFGWIRSLYCGLFTMLHCYLLHHFPQPIHLTVNH